MVLRHILNHENAQKLLKRGFIHDPAKGEKVQEPHLTALGSATLLEKRLRDVTAEQSYVCRSTTAAPAVRAEGKRGGYGCGAHVPRPHLRPVPRILRTPPRRLYRATPAHLPRSAAPPARPSSQRRAPTVHRARCCAPLRAAPQPPGSLSAQALTRAAGRAGGQRLSVPHGCGPPPPRAPQRRGRQRRLRPPGRVPAHLGAPHSPAPLPPSWQLEVAVASPPCLWARPAGKRVRRTPGVTPNGFHFV